MDPLTALGALGAGYLLVSRAKSKSDAEKQDAAPQTEQPLLLQEHTYLSSRQMAAFVTGIINVEATIPVTQVDGNIRTEQDLRQQFLGSMNSPVINVVGFIIAAITAVALVAFMFGIEVDRLSKGRLYYYRQLKDMAQACIASLKLTLAALPNVTDAQRKDFIVLFTYVMVRAFNRANLNWCLTLRGNLADVVAGLPDDLRIGYWADRGLCLPEKGYIRSNIMATPGLPRSMAAMEGADADGALDYHILDARNESEVKARLAGIWNDEIEGVADFVGRAIAATAQLSQPGHIVPEYMPDAGVIGNNTPRVYVYDGSKLVQRPDDGKWVEAPSPETNYKDKYIFDGTLRTPLKWYYSQSATQQRAVVKQ